MCDSRVWVGFTFDHSQRKEKKTKKEKIKKGVYKDVVAHDVVKYGVIPELVGRLPIIVSLENLDEDALVRILKEPKNAVYKQYQKLLKMDGVELEFDDDAFSEIAKMAIERETGARGLRSILESIMLKPMYDIPSLEGAKKVVITREFVQGKEPLNVVYEDKND